MEDRPFVTLLKDESGYNDGRIYLVNNGCFLVNYGMIDPDKAALADALLDEVGLVLYGDVLFLESGPSDLPVSDSEYEEHNTWGWISQPPLRYIVPQFLFWGILFCLVYFPIFGRPRRSEMSPDHRFGHHIQALARQLRRSRRSAEAEAAIERYQELVEPRGLRQRPSSDSISNQPHS